MSVPPSCEITQQLVRQLSHRLRQWEKSGRVNKPTRIASGCAPLDRLLPGGGFAGGSLVEWIAAAPAGGATILALLAAREACRQGGALVVLDRQRVFYPPAAAILGIDLDRTVLVRPTNDPDEFWALDQVLRCRHVAAVLAWPKGLDALTFRRMQLAAEMGGGLGLLVRSAAARTQPSWADVRWLVSPRRDWPHDGWRLRVQLLRCRGRLGGEKVELEIDELAGMIHETHPGDLAPELANAIPDRHSARA